MTKKDQEKYNKLKNDYDNLCQKFNQEFSDHQRSKETIKQLLETNREWEHEAKKLLVRNDALQYSLVIIQSVIRDKETEKRKADHKFVFDKEQGSWKEVSLAV